MHLFTRLARPLFTLAAIALFPISVSAQFDGSLKAASSPAIEARTLVRLLQEVHYNRDSVDESSYSQVIPDYMAILDGQHLFFLEEDKQGFIERYQPESLYQTVAAMGKMDPAFLIFDRYKERAAARVAWIQEALKADFDFESDDTYLIDRTKAVWPASAEDADKLWDRRIRFELIKEILNKKTLEEAKVTVGKRYDRLLKNVTDIEPSDITEMFLGSIARLYDPHSTYFSADTYEDFGIQMRLQLVGIGALLGVEEDECVIKDIIPGGPADLDKQLKPNDKIIAVAQEGEEPIEVIGMKLRKIVDMIRGPKGTPVRLIVEPAATGNVAATRKEIVLVRNVVNLDSSRAHGAIFEVPDAEGNISPIGVITLPTFYGPEVSSDGKPQNSATRDVRELITRLKAAKIKGLVLDLRRNGGGLLSEAISLTGLFIEKGPVVQVRSYSGEIKVDHDTDASIAYGGPLTVLVSRYSASASEIVAGALQNYGRAVIVGDSSTHGKGTVQTVLELRNLVPLLNRADTRSGATKLTVQKFYLPDGASTQLKGVVPDIILPSFEDYLPIGEADMPHALTWDSVAPSKFAGRPLAPSALTPLVAASAARQDTLEEFSYLRRAIDRFKTRQEQKAVSLNLEQRKQQKQSDEEFRKAMAAEKKELAAGAYKFSEVLLAPPPPPRPKLTPPDNDSVLEEEESEANLRYVAVDIQLREALRVASDLINKPRAVSVAKDGDRADLTNTTGATP